jgi:hypothetical protein
LQCLDCVQSNGGVRDVGVVQDASSSINLTCRGGIPHQTPKLLPKVDVVRLVVGDGLIRSLLQSSNGFKLCEHTGVISGTLSSSEHLLVGSNGSFKGLTDQLGGCTPGRQSLDQLLELGTAGTRGNLLRSLGGAGVLLDRRNDPRVIHVTKEPRNRLKIGFLSRHGGSDFLDGLVVPLPTGIRQGVNVDRLKTRAERLR